MRHCILTLANVLIISSCLSHSYEGYFMDFSVDSKSLQQKAFGVSVADIYNMFDKQEIQNIICFPSEESPLLYGVNLVKDGFFLFSADMRTYPIVAYSEIGEMNLDEDSKWLWEEFSAPIKEVQKTIAFSDEMEGNILFWQNFTTSNSISLQRNKAAGSYQYLIMRRISPRTVMNKGPLLETSWGQGNKNTGDHYWNEYCPWSSSSCTGNKCPVGCVAVAAGQEAFFLRNRPGVSISIPREASCSGYATGGSDGQYYSQSFSDRQSYSYIDEMPWNYNSTSYVEREHARIFLAYIGNTIHMKYGPSGSSSHIDSLPNLFQMWGINTRTSTFQESDTWSSIDANTPVIVQAQRDNRFGHAWVLDGIQETIMVIRSFYYVTDTELTQEQIDSLRLADVNHVEEERFTDGIYYHMNYGNNGRNDGWYSYDNWEYGDISYNLNKLMLVVE